jgi:NAD(P)-dependent dehydrogenase (short-subunit alcohol dehydrogenase family)
MPTALVTGASSGIGAAAVAALHGAGYQVAFTARRAERIRGLAERLDPAGARVLPLEGDVTSPGHRADWVAATVARFGGLDLLVNNAGYGQRGAVESVPLEAMRRNFETNVFAALGLVQEALPHLRAAAPRGRVVMVSSVAGRIARPLSSTYDATKHALEAFTDGLRQELWSEGVRVVSVMPGFIRTEFGEAARRESAAEIGALEKGRYAALWARVLAGEAKGRRFAGTPEDVARVIVRAALASRPRRRYPVPGHARVLLALRRFLPEFVFSSLLPR